MKHPVFWDANQKLKFLVDVSDRLETLSFEDSLVQRLEQGGREVISGAVGKNATFKSSLRKKATFHICKKNIASQRKKIWGFILEVRTIGAITIVLQGQKYNAFISFVVLRTTKT